ncbi:MAG: hypothetical protein A2921_00310 [Candidatus Magasanikbacteria bacterium RIFCSPLOWO2_01_FULL_43_20b]|uniref:Uncharacterized protein n=1 Tax=Candidatus Magasanikbacteria bacterium RIFCSPLOWO2_12_FULL_43_12 TaxID=1798692 RepID=A0A1F6MS62_9BACT|nr:MAG: hypothetical protein A3C74_02045 [Candidatus Magasanikbacteria bacterium RIFCSPHIGHO2_02_FULL_44_13]OGH72745.1 MAG: hypothetical protein A3I93_01040 [Candidatus Magasanikbacteria bacterium RIFCSPLOWO2_02_FULL_43_22]OGH73180.1 MAG: hypothetical protein A2921_00310 [Candidatus Magasanikbacteria bacterium RIFCSPLOWO2_01_FULL_43_20b]OGH74388.1 MAG: hypothetical protein A3G00_04420 [Candidatus Magasanikbacteria bacterium RIFCSPLOWO2_12_FULL_43_12]
MVRLRRANSRPHCFVYRIISQYLFFFKGLGNIDWKQQCVLNWKEICCSFHLSRRVARLE